MNKVLRTNVQELANETIETIRGVLTGKAPMTDKIRESIRFVALGIKVEHMDQIAEQSNRSFAIRLLPHLSKDMDRDEYIKRTNPQLIPALLARPKEMTGKK